MPKKTTEKGDLQQFGPASAFTRPEVARWRCGRGTGEARQKPVSGGPRKKEFQRGLFTKSNDFKMSEEDESQEEATECGSSEATGGGRKREGGGRQASNAH